MTAGAAVSSAEGESDTCAADAWALPAGSDGALSAATESGPVRSPAATIAPAVPIRPVLFTLTCPPQIGVGDRKQSPPRAVATTAI